MKHLDFLRRELDRLDRAGLLRPRGETHDSSLTVACSNDYLGYGSEIVSRETSTRAAPLGAGASRLVSGTTNAHLELERWIASWLGSEATLLFSSGYLANFSTISALVGAEDVVFSDRLNHASIVDGCRHSRAKIHIYEHRDLDHLEQLLRGTPLGEGRRLVVTESYFSMDGDSPDLRRVAQLCRDHSALLLVDEAHALGVFGPGGAGLARGAGIYPDITIGTFGKAVGSAGAFVSGSNLLCDWLWNRARGFVYSTAPSPWLSAFTLERLKRLALDETARAHLDDRCRRFETRLAQLGIRLSQDRHGPIFPVVVGTPEAASQAAARLRGEGFLVQAIRPPTVPEGSSRLRVVLNATFSHEQVDRLALAVFNSLKT